MVAMTNDDVTTDDITTAETSGPNWSLLAKFVPGIALALLFLVWLLMGAGGSAD